MSESRSGLARILERLERAETEVPRVEDPGKDYRSASGLPIVPAFDGFRALAILGVVALHLITIQGVADAEQTGLSVGVVWGLFGRAVEVLFVVSGFVVFLPTVARSGRFGSVGAYALRRAARLAPAYWLALLFTIVLLYVFSDRWDEPSFAEIWTHALFLQTPAAWIDPSIQPGLVINLPLWTLSIEVIFYALLPLVAAWYVRHPFFGLLIALGITAGWSEVLHNIGWFNDLFGTSFTGLEALAGMNQFPAWALSFASGMTAAWIYVNYALERRGIFANVSRVNFAAVVSVAALIGFGIWSGSVASDVGGLFSFIEQPLLLGLGFTLSLGATMLFVSAAGRFIQAPFANPFVRWLGDISYGVYLSHYALIAVALNVVGVGVGEGWLGLLILPAFVLPLSLVYGYLSARFLEQPVRRWAHRFGARAQAGVQPRPES